MDSFYFVYFPKEKDFSLVRVAFRFEFEFFFYVFV